MYFRPKMKGLFSGLFAICVIAACSQPVDFVTDDGRDHSLHVLSERPVIYNFWAEWCKPCIKEIPEFNRLFRYIKTHHPDVLLFAVSYDALSNEALLALKDKLGIQYPLVLSDPNPMLPVSLPGVLPTTWLVAKNGELFELKGEQSFESLKKHLKNLVELQK